MEINTDGRFGVASELKYNILFCSSDDNKHTATGLLEGKDTSKGWCTTQFTQYPQEIGIQFGRKVQINQIQFLSHRYKIANKIELFVGDIDPQESISVLP